MSAPRSVRPPAEIRGEPASLHSLRPWLLVLALVGLGAGLRVMLRDVPNFAPVAALALFAGYSLRSLRMAVCVPLGVMALSDWVIGGYDGTMMAIVYGMLAFPVVLGFPLRRWLGMERGAAGHAALATAGLVGCSLLSSVLFFTVTNFACWLSMDIYALDGSGLVHCYTQALPFFRYTLLGDLAFSVVLFSGYAIAVTAGWTPATLRPARVRS